MSRSKQKNHHRYTFYEEEEDYSKDCCDSLCKFWVRQTSFKSMCAYLGVFCIFILGMITTFASSNSNQRILGNWNSSIANHLVRESTWNRGQKEIFNSSDTIYVITPTYGRPNQKSILTALAQTFYFIDNLHWIIVEDSPTLNPWLVELMDRFQFNFTQIACDKKMYCQKHNCKKITAKGSVPRNCGLMWMKSSNIQNGILYFADDDNFYDVRLFDEIRKTKKVSVFPVGGFRDTGLSSPIMVNGKIVKFIDPWIHDRKWPVDMAGFAVGIAEWRAHNYPLFTHTKGYLETNFLGDLKVTKETLEVLGSNATEVLVWHNTIRKEACNKKSAHWKHAEKGVKKSNLDILKKIIHC